MLHAREEQQLESQIKDYRIEPNWTDEEFVGVDLQDTRLDKRLFKVSAQFAMQP